MQYTAASSSSSNYSNTETLMNVNEKHSNKLIKQNFVLEDLHVVKIMTQNDAIYSSIHSYILDIPDVKTLK